jgi:hypothetical protein
MAGNSHRDLLIDDTYSFISEDDVVGERFLESALRRNDGLRAGGECSRECTLYMSEAIVRCC